jgi:hypothetical protein
MADELKYFDGGAPYGGRANSTNSTDMLKYFDTGAPYNYRFVTAAPPAPTNTGNFFLMF